MIARQISAEWAPALARLRRLLTGHSGPQTADYRPAAERVVGPAESISLLGFFSALIALLTAGAVIGGGYAASDVLVLLVAQLITSLVIWRVRWRNVVEIWMPAIVGIQIVFVASLITLTGGPASPYVALYAPVLALAGWHLRPWQAATVVAFIGANEVWRAATAGGQLTFDQLRVALPAFALITLMARLSSDRVEQAVALNRRDQVRTAATLFAVRALGDIPPANRLTDMPGLAAEVFDARAWIHTPGTLPHARHACGDAATAAHHVAAPIHGAGTTHGTLRLCRDDPFSSSERRLASILADAMGHALDSRVVTIAGD